MFSQNAGNFQQQQHQNHPSPIAPFISPPSTMGFDGNPYFNLDPSSAAKQMAALNAANVARVSNGRLSAPSASQQPMGGTTPASYLGGMSSSINQPNGLATPSHSNPLHIGALGSLSGHPNSQAPAYPMQQQPNINLSSNSPLVDHSISQMNLAARQLQTPAAFKLRQRNFLQGIAGLHASRNAPLPPALSGHPYPVGYDPSQSQWKSIELTNEVGVFRLAGKDVDLVKLYGLVFQNGGYHKFNQQNAWTQILHHFDLPEHFPFPQPNGQQSVAATLANYYAAILLPFEDVYKRNVQDHHRKAMMAVGRQPNAPQAPNPGSTIGPYQGATGGPMQSGYPSQNTGGNMNSMLGMLGQPASSTHDSTMSLNDSPQFPPPLQSMPHSPHQRQSSSGPMMQSPGPLSSGNLDTFPALPATQSLNGSYPVSQISKEGSNLFEDSMAGGKRKHESGEMFGKRARPRKDGSEPPEQVLPASSDNTTMSANVPPGNVASSSPSALSNSTRSRPKFTRWKVEYLPIAREVETCGGRDINQVEEEYVRARRKPVRDINDWGAVDIEALTMSLRSRLATELSYGLTTFSLLSTMRGPTQGSGFPIFQCLDLLEEVLDLMEEQAFEGVPDVAEYALTEERCIPRHRELLDTAYDEESQHFAGLQPRQGSGDSSYGPRQRPGTIILAVMNILRNLSIIADNMTFLAHHERVLDLALRVCGVTVQDGGPPRANSPALSLIDVATVRKDTLYILTSIAGMIQYPPSRSPSNTTTRIASRTFELIASFLIDPVDAVSPVTYLRQTGGPPTSSKPPPLSDIALEVFTRLGHPDLNRMVFSKVIPQTWQWRLFEALIHRLPISDADYGLLAREAWLCYLEKLTMAIYALAFLAPPDLKQKIKMDRSLSFSQVMLRMVQRLLVGPNPETRAWYMIAARRSVEAMKVVDGCEDSFDTSQSTVPTLAFGVGYGEAGDSGVEKGTGMLGGRREVAWDLLMLRDMEPPMFAELESLMRVE